MAHRIAPPPADREGEARLGRDHRLVGEDKVGDEIPPFNPHDAARNVQHEA
ncbi:MAG TPA: hypothetical protein VJ890_13665 [Vineibacter sp.]|nr:hypothetical protein [Vineibacter sp.]